MPRAHRHFLPEHVWHITHRCHQQAFLLKFARDRRRYLRWLFEAKKRFGLCVLNYTVTSNHIHLLVKDTVRNVIPQSMQLIAGRTAQDYNQRKERKGAFWEDRYHATAIEADGHLHRCLVYIDLNMVRAGVVKHPLRSGNTAVTWRSRIHRRAMLSSTSTLSARCAALWAYRNFRKHTANGSRKHSTGMSPREMIVGRRPLPLAAGSMPTGSRLNLGIKHCVAKSLGWMECIYCGSPAGTTRIVYTVKMVF